MCSAGRLERAGASTILTVTGEGMDTLAQPIAKADLLRIRIALDIIEIRADEGWLVAGGGSAPAGHGDERQPRHRAAPGRSAAEGMRQELARLDAAEPECEVEDMFGRGVNPTWREWQNERNGMAEKLNKRTRPGRSIST
jgi:hypothetical protein